MPPRTCGRAFGDETPGGTPDVIYLLERQVGYGDNEGIAFPSIKGCLAVGLQTEDGIFGFHNAGNGAPEAFVAGAKKCAGWVRMHPKGRRVP